jgi:hypothetical protein
MACVIPTPVHHQSVLWIVILLRTNMASRPVLRAGVKKGTAIPIRVRKSTIHQLPAFLKGIGLSKISVSHLEVQPQFYFPAINSKFWNPPSLIYRCSRLSYKEFKHVFDPIIPPLVGPRALLYHRKVQDRQYCII